MERKRVFWSGRLSARGSEARGRLEEDLKDSAAKRSAMNNKRARVTLTASVRKLCVINNYNNTIILQSRVINNDAIEIE